MFVLTDQDRTNHMLSKLTVFFATTCVYVIIQTKGKYIIVVPC